MKNIEKWKYTIKIMCSCFGSFWNRSGACDYSLVYVCMYDDDTGLFWRGETFIRVSWSCSGSIEVKRMKLFYSMWLVKQGRSSWYILVLTLLVSLSITLFGDHGSAFALSGASERYENQRHMYHVSKSDDSMQNYNNKRAKEIALTFDDEFTTASLNTSIWNIEDYATDHYQNCCLKFGTQYFTTRDVSLNQGMLRLRSENRTLGGRDYTSGAVTTENKFSFLFGRVDIRARIPWGQGMWSAFWLLTSNADHEVDMMEMVNNPTKQYQTLHMNIPSYNTFVSQCNVQNQDLSTGFHLYSLEWYPTSLSWFIDGVQTCHMTQSIPQTPMYLLLDTAVGGAWPGSPDASTMFPQYTDIDYVRISQPPSYNSCSGLLVKSPLHMDQKTLARGGTIHGTVTYTNACNTTFVLKTLIVASRKPCGGNADFGNKSGPVTLAPGQSVTITGSRVIQMNDPIGQWDAFSSFQTPDGVWHPDGTNLQYFTVTK